MRVFVAGGSGVPGRRLVPQVVARDHRVTATTPSAAGLGPPRGLGADGVVRRGPDAESAGGAVAGARPDVLVHRTSAIPACAGARPPLRIPVRPARLPAGDQAVVRMTEGRGSSDARAERELGRRLRHPSWRQGFREGLA
ncbi:hypothetical protein ACFVHB_10925 [Kitasatospora sp. NPDC127111]|uniref:hypothetical protein n=1 Tax=Kitasatospora sp. NPDC127111 TaxID=3345363 RepID=UPI003629275C